MNCSRILTSSNLYVLIYLITLQTNFARPLIHLGMNYAEQKEKEHIMNIIKITVILLLTASLNTTIAQKDGKSKKSKSKNEMTLKTELDTVSYGLGVNIAENLTNQGLEELNVAALAKGMEDYLSKSDLKLSKEEIGTLLNSYMQSLQGKAGEKNKIAGEEFLAANAKKKGIITLPSGMQYEIIKEGTGPIPTAENKVSTHYHGTLIDGTVFDSSVDRGQPAEFGVTQVIQGWQEALQLMPEGSKWKLYIPYNLAYGDRGAGGAIGPYSTLIFDIELLKIVE
jgi:FKBP-type peptidyl-prolyl cis-trans isomerase FklB